MLIYGGAVLGIALAGGAVWWFTRQKDDSTGADSLFPEGTAPRAAAPPPPIPPKPAAPATPPAPSGFPLRQGSRGTPVSQMQAALNARHGAKLTVDGIFGPLTAAALKAAGFGSTVDEATFGSITAGAAHGAATPQAIAAGLAIAVRAGNFPDALAQLRRMASASDYKAVSDIYKEVYVESVRKTVVNAMVGNSSKWQPAEKEQARREFLRMGLLYDSPTDTWKMPSGLSGIGPRLQAYAVRNAVAWDVNGMAHHLAAGQHLGTVSSASGGRAVVVTPPGLALVLPTQDIVLA